LLPVTSAERPNELEEERHYSMKHDES